MRDSNREDTKLVFCKDCKWYGHPCSKRCTNPQLSWMSLVDGEGTYEKAEYQRYSGKCGLEGKYFELKGAEK